MLRLPRLFRLHRTGGVGASLIAVAIGLTLLAGCAEEEPKPKFEAEPSIETTPAADDKNNPRKATVKEFLIRWAEIEADMQNTGETAEYAALSPGCDACEGLIEQVDEIYASDGFIRTSAMTIEKVKRIGKTDEYKVWASLPPTVFRESHTDPEESLSGGPQGYLFHVARSNNDFSVTGYVRTPR